MSTELTRRSLLKTTALAGGGLLLHALFPARAEAAASAGPAALNAWLRITPDDRVTIVVSQAEMGQGIATTLPAVLADELDADWIRVTLENAPADPAYRNPRLKWQFTGNSESTTAFYDLMRTMGASAREMLIAAAAARWRVSPSSCRAENGKVIHGASGRSLKFGDLAEAAAKLEPPAHPTLKPRKKWKLVGRSLPRVDNPSKVDGTAVFGMDVKVDGMVYAAVRTSPVFGGKVERFDGASIEGRPGVLGVFPIPSGVAVVAKSYWLAKKALDAIEVVFDDGPNAAASSESLAATYRTALEGNDWVVVHEGKVAEALPTVVSAEYESQFLAHATMEPMNCTARVTSDGCDIWAPTQGQELTQLVASQVLGMPKERVRVHRTLLGGGFGRRLIADFAVQAVLISKAVGRPVKVIWSREEDMQHDVYRPAVLHRLAAGIDEEGKLQTMAHKLVSPTILQLVYPPGVTDTFDPSCVEGLVETHYAIPSWRVEFKLIKVPVPTSVLRTTGYGPNIFALESFIDELAHKKGDDPYRYRRRLLRGNRRALAVLDAVAARSGWARPPRPGRHRGIAFCDAFHTFIAHVVELSVSPDQGVTLHRVVAAVDPGTTLDQGITTNNIEGGVAWALSCAFKSEITFERGRTVQSNWHDYEVLRLPEMPPVDVHLIDSDARPLGGTGEVGPVTVIPALTNALFAATGRRIRSLPLRKHGFHIAGKGNVA
jgi:isoquinoline 1-oxidoreductase subunit beta